MKRETPRRAIRRGVFSCWARSEFFLARRPRHDRSSHGGSIDTCRTTGPRGELRVRGASGAIRAAVRTEESAQGATVRSTGTRCSIATPRLIGTLRSTGTTRSTVTSRSTRTRRSIGTTSLTVTARFTRTTRSIVTPRSTVRTRTAKSRIGRRTGFGINPISGPFRWYEGQAIQRETRWPG